MDLMKQYACSDCQIKACKLSTEILVTCERCGRMQLHEECPRKVTWKVKFCGDPKWYIIFHDVMTESLNPILPGGGKICPPPVFPPPS